MVRVTKDTVACQKLSYVANILKTPYHLSYENVSTDWGDSLSKSPLLGICLACVYSAREVEQLAVTVVFLA